MELGEPLFACPACCSDLCGNPYFADRRNKCATAGSAAMTPALAVEPNALPAVQLIGWVGGALRTIKRAGILLQR